MLCIRAALVAFMVLAACARPASAPPPSPLEPERRVVLPPRTSTGALTQAERDSLLREVAVHREAWRARGISDYQIDVAAGCFCPWPSNPGRLEVRRGVVVALRDTTGKAMGKPREPWSLYTVEGLFDAVEQSAKRVDVLQVAYDPEYGYPAMMRGDGRLAYPDDWFWVRASRLRITGN